MYKFNFKVFLFVAVFTYNVHKLILYKTSLKCEKQKGGRRRNDTSVISKTKKNVEKLRRPSQPLWQPRAP